MQSFKEFLAEQDMSEKKSNLNEDDFSKHVKIYGFGGHKSLEDVFGKNSEKVSNALHNHLYGADFSSEMMQKAIIFLNQNIVENNADVSSWSIYHNKNKIDKIIFRGSHFEMTFTY